MPATAAHPASDTDIASAVQADIAVLIGRFQPFHNSHLALLQHALQATASRDGHVIVVLGSAHQARHPKNPFTWAERASMIAACLPPQQASRVHFLPVRDYYDMPRWVRAVQHGVQDLATRLHPCATGNAAPRIAIVGHFKDPSSSYLAHFPDWHLLETPRLGQFDATPIRELYWNRPGLPAEQVLAALAPQIPTPVLRWLGEWMLSPDYAALQGEWRMLCDYRQSWQPSPFPPVFVTVDTLLLCAGHILLIQRGRSPGKGLWALPGGFLEPRDTLWQSCMRELAEETRLSLPETTLRTALQGVQVFDHPDRSQRGRTITHVHIFHLPGDSLPPVTGADDAALARWVPLHELPAMEANFFEDHFHVLHQCFARFGNGPALLPH